jgi:hypothetical protein
MKKYMGASCLARASDNGDKHAPLGNAHRAGRRRCQRLSPIVTGKKELAPATPRAGVDAKLAAVTLRRNR